MAFMTMINYDFCKLVLLWQANATAFQAAQLATRVRALITESEALLGCHLPEDKEDLTTQG